MDLAHEHYEILDRNAALPNHLVVAGVYWFDPINGPEFRRLRRAARVHAALLGADDVTMPAEHNWRYSEGNTDRFCTVVDAAVVQGADFVELSGHALANADGHISRCELVGDGELDN